MAKPLQFNFNHRTWVFKLNLGFLCFCLFFFSLFCFLGVWQLERYHYKQTLLNTYQQHLTAAPVLFSSTLQPQPFQTVFIQGRYLNNLTMLVQNQFYQDHLGFEVLTPVQMPNNKKLLLVDRGWIAKPSTAALPVITGIKGTQHIVGYIKKLDEKQFILGENILNKTTSPLVMQKIDVAEISSLTHEMYYPFVIRLNASAAGGYVRDWTITTMLPERHLGYAVQWFAMALVLLIAYLFFCCERINNEKNN